MLAPFKRRPPRLLATERFPVNLTVDGEAG